MVQEVQLDVVEPPRIEHPLERVADKRERLGVGEIETTRASVKHRALGAPGQPLGMFPVEMTVTIDRKRREPQTGREAGRADPVGQGLHAFGEQVPGLPVAPDPCVIPGRQVPASGDLLAHQVDLADGQWARRVVGPRRGGEHAPYPILEGLRLGHLLLLVLLGRRRRTAFQLLDRLQDRGEGIGRLGLALGLDGRQLRRRLGTGLGLGHGFGFGFRFGLGIRRRRHGGHLRTGPAGDGQALVDRLVRDATAVDLDAGQALERHRREHPVVLEDGGATVVKARMYAEDEHAVRPGRHAGWK